MLDIVDALHRFVDRITEDFGRKKNHSSGQVKVSDTSSDKDGKIQDRIRVLEEDIQIERSVVAGLKKIQQHKSSEITKLIDENKNIKEKLDIAKNEFETRKIEHIKQITSIKATIKKKLGYVPKDMFPEE